MQTQTVSYVIQGQLEGLAGLCVISLVTLFLLFNYTKNIALKIFIFASMLLIAIISCGTKEIAIVSPVMMLLADWFFIAQTDWKSLKKRAWFHALMLLIVFCSYIYLLRPEFFYNLFSLSMEAKNNIGNVLTERQEDSILPLHYAISEFKVILHYFWIFVWPFNISVDYDWKMVRSFFDLDCILPFIVLCLCAVFVLKKLYKNDIMSFAALWFFVAILPRASIIPSSELVADYKTYLSSVGVFLFFSIGFLKLYDFLIEKFNFLKSRIFMIILTLSASGFLFAITRIRNKVWSSPVDFWYNIIKNAPNKARGYNNYGVSLSELNKHDEAIPYFQKAIAMDNKYP